MNDPNETRCGCGGTMKAHWTLGNYQCVCDHCGISTKIHSTKAEALTAFRWATRADEVERLRKENRRLEEILINAGLFDDV